MFGSLLICMLGKSLNIKYLSSAKIFTENTFYRLLKIFVQSSCSTDFLPVVPSVPKKYLVETEDDNDDQDQG